MDTAGASSAGLNDQGSGGTGSPWGYLTNNGADFSSGTGPNGQDCLNFVNDGAGNDEDYLDGGSHTWDGAGNDVSWSIWATLDVLSSTGNWLMSWRNSTNDRLLHTIFYNDTTDAHAWSMGDTDDDFVNPTTTTPTVTADGTTWYHLAATYNGTSKLLTCYVDGVERTSLTYTLDSGRPTVSMEFAIGTLSPQGATNTTSHDGKLMSAGIWDVALTESEINHLWANGNGRKYADMIIV